MSRLFISLPAKYTWWRRKRRAEPRIFYIHGHLCRLRVKLRFARGISWPKNSLRDISSGFETRVRIISFDVFRERFVDRYRFRLGPYNLLSIRTAHCFQLETHSYYNIAGVCQTRVGNTGRFKHFERYREISLPICARSWWALTL